MTEAPDHLPDGDHAAVVDLLGALGYAMLSAFGEMAGDAHRAPDLRVKTAVAGLAVHVYHHQEEVVARIAGHGADPASVMAGFAEPIDAFHERTRPGDWIEGLVKAYVGNGIARDFYAEVARFVDQGTRDFVLRILDSDTDRTEVIAGIVRQAIDQDARLGGRLALWARRIMGEAMQQAQRVGVERDALTQLLVGGRTHGADIAELGRMFARIADGHTARMQRLGLDA